MKSKLLAVLLVGVLTNMIYSQTESEFRKKYDAQEFFEIRPKILMKAEYNAAGEVCSVFFQPNYFSRKEKTVFVGNSTIDLDDLLDVIDEVIPSKTRKGTGASLGWIMQGGMMWGGYAFDNVRVNTKRASSAKKTGFLEKRPSDSTGLIDYLNSFGSPETAAITWLQRLGCVE